MKINRFRRQWLLPFILIISLLLTPMSVSADVQYESFTKNNFGHLVWTQPAYYPVSIIGDSLYIQNEENSEQQAYSPMQNPQDLFIDPKDHIYIVDTGNNRIVHFDENGSWIRYISLPDNPLNQPHGIFVTEKGIIYIADTGNKRVVKLDENGQMLQEFHAPVSRFIPENYKYDPIKLIVDERGYIYITTLGGYQGLLQLKPDGEFSSFYGTNLTKMTVVDSFKKALYSREMWENEISKLPGAIRNATVDDDGFIYTVTSGGDTTNEQVKKLNIEGSNILAQYNENGKRKVKKSYGEVPWNGTRKSSRNNSLDPQLIDVAVDRYGNITVIDANFNVISQYDATGTLLFFWSGRQGTGSTQLGVVKNPIAIDVNSRNEMFLLDNQENIVHKYELTEFGSKVHEANSLTMEGRYAESEEQWQEVLRLNANFGPAIEGLAMAAYKKEEYSKSASMFFRSGNQKGYSDAFWQTRLEWFQENFSWFATMFVILFFIMMSFGRLTRKMKWRQKWDHRKRSNRTIVIQLKQALYILKHPLDGFTGLRQENKGGYLSASIILAVVLAALVISQAYTSFTFNQSAPFKVNLFNIFLSFFVGWVGWVICNYLISSIYRGEGRFKDVFVGSAYALTPLIIIGIPLALMSNIMTDSEKAIYDYIYYGMITWVGLLFFWKVQSLQNYSIGETIYNIVLSLFSMVIMGVLIFIMFGLTNELRTFIYEVYQEVTLR